MSHAAIDPHTFDELQANAGADFVAELVDTFAEEAPPLLDEMRKAVADGAAERFRRAAHSIKSNSSTFGATWDLTHVKGIGRKSFRWLRPYLAVQGETTLAALQALARP